MKPSTKMNPLGKYKFYGILACVILFFIIPLMGNDYIIHVAILMLMNILLAISLRVTYLTGYISFGQSAPAAIGAYSSAFLVMKIGLPFEISFITAALVATIFGTVLGAVAMKVRGAYFLLLTLAYVEVVRLIISVLEPWTMGVTGLVGIPSPSFFGIPIESPKSIYIFFCCISLIIIYFTFRVEKSSLGLVWQGIGQNSELCDSVGINTYRHRVLAFAISSFVPGIVGSFYAHYMGVIFPDTFGWLWGAYIAFYNFIGGMGSFFGPILGAVFLTGISEPLRGVAEYEMLFFALVMVIVVIFMPEGIISLPKRARAVFKHLFYVSAKRNNLKYRPKEVTGDRD